ncbi:peptide-binding protein [Rubrimonas cliftonensis]|uniref:SH3 domain-containing protein n=1 Tax=Rubrimonas cliftonensis TaxID=89524 RepID=A0A1H3Y9L6_9RHOB|nr:peptide-binding protein [Rubrimonas cliftonensis]SEA08325.1 hypothetical protein SAMN05444370_1037 [Rubrimonas cliftonensis]
MGVNRAAPIASLLAGLLAGFAHAQALFTAPAHPLPVRDAPGGDVIGALEPGATPVESTGADGAWLRIGFGERDGWVARDALSPTETPMLAGSQAPDGLLCSGTEPFWSLRLEAATTLRSPDGDGPALTLHGVAPAVGMSAFPARVDYGPLVAVLRPLACADGMSDRTQAWTVDVLDGDRLLTGCCRLSP